jgi:hypothetical protein
MQKQKYFLDLKCFITQVGSMAEKLTLFTKHEEIRILGALTIPDHTTEALDNYFLRGFQPGGFLTSILTNNLYGAVGSADAANRHVIYEITLWLTRSDMIIPYDSFGSVERVIDWLHDKNSIRTNFVDKFEKEYIWKTLKA